MDDHTVSKLRLTKIVSGVWNSKDRTARKKSTKGEGKKMYLLYTVGPLEASDSPDYRMDSHRKSKHNSLSLVHCIMPMDCHGFVK